MASQAKQVFYITDPANKKWSIILSMKPNIITDGNVENDIGNNIDEIPSFSLRLTKGDNIDNIDVMISRNMTSTLEKIIDPHNLVLEWRYTNECQLLHG